MKNVFGKGMQLQTLSLAPILGNNDFILPDKYLILSLSEDGEKNQRKTDPIRGHSTTTWTKFDPILTPSPLELTICDILHDT